jgi:hypothetical protein
MPENTEESHNYANLIKNFCKINDLDDVETLIEKGTLNLADVDFLLFYDKDADPEGMTITCQLESPAYLDKNTRHRRMLEMNLFLMYQDGPRAVLSPDSDSEWLTLRLNVSKTDAEELTGAIYQLASVATRWKTGELCPSDDALKGNSTTNTIPPGVSFQANL